jgi:CheY-like chemotaxis protein
MKQISIFFADDDADDRAFFSEAIQEIGKSVVCYSVKDGSGIFNLLVENSTAPDIIFLDINMPVLDGWDSLLRLKSDVKYARIPVIMYSTTGLLVHVQKALTLGALCLVTKPDNFNRIKEILAEVIVGLPNDVFERIKHFQEVKHITLHPQKV